ncbi:putative NAD/FAD-binding protein [Inhella inkyongensis]|uniref:Putative NAD/FAD-binding protein n=1 Tax=Inhella inkyongensis TaxID=392593 RepID=A0A840S394_9BURK|nr:FAD-dependent oxidoreductase [Inhella inkyongensis]MBB5203009.1 putative NAD/FAD-binding protein [Inhella inkyongensis]
MSTALPLPDPGLALWRAAPAAAGRGPADHGAPLLPWLRDSGSPRDGRSPRRVAVVGAGITGLGAAWALRHRCEVSLFEADARLGGHAHTVDLELDGVRHGVDTGFLVFNERTYPLLIELFRQLEVPLAASDMSFSVQQRTQGIEWSGSSLATVFAQARNLLRPAFLGMLADLLRFNRECTALAQAGDDAALAESVGDFLARRRFGTAFRELYLLPMVACIWSCPTQQMLQFPIGTLIRFCHNHGLLQVAQRPQWFTVRGGSREYVQRLAAQLPQVHQAQPALGLQRRPEGGVLLRTAAGVQAFDAVILACHSDQALALLEQARPSEQALLGAIRYQSNRAVLHGDATVLPQRQRAWAAWNFEAAVTDSADQPVCLHYLINRLQPLPWQRPVVVSLNPLREPQGIWREFEYAHPVLDAGAVRAQARLPEIQGQGGLFFAGAWTRYGFHEDGLLSGLQAARACAEQLMALDARP